MNNTIEKMFTYHKPINDQQERYEMLRNKAKELAYIMDNNCPNSYEKDTAMTYLGSAVMWANAAIARNEK